MCVCKRRRERVCERGSGIGEGDCVCEKERERSLECVNEGAACMVERGNPCACVTETEAASVRVCVGT